MISAAGDQFHINGDWCAISLSLWQPYDNVIHVEIVFKGWNHFGGIPSFFRDWALGDTDRLRINKGPSCVKNYLTPLCKEAAASIDQKLDAQSNHFSGCRLNEQLISFILGSSVQMVYPLAHNNTSVTPFHTILGCIRLVFVMANEKVSPSKIVCH